MSTHETGITVEDLESDYRPILEWYVHQPASRGSKREAARTVLSHGISGRYQVKVVIDACELYLTPRELSERRREEAEAVLEEMEALYRAMDDSEVVVSEPEELSELRTPDGKVML